MPWCRAESQTPGSGRVPGAAEPVFVTPVCSHVTRQILRMVIFLSALKCPQQRRGQTCWILAHQSWALLLRPVSFCISSSPSGLVSPDCTPRPWHWQHGLLPLISVMEGQEMTVPRSSVDEMMQKPKFKSFFLTYSFILLLATHHPNRHHFKAVFRALLEFLVGFWLPSGKQGTFSFHGHLLISWAFPGLGEGAVSPDKLVFCLAGLDLTLAQELGLSQASRSGQAPASSCPASSWLSVASQTRLWPPVPSLGI